MWFIGKSFHRNLKIARGPLTLLFCNCPVSMNSLWKNSLRKTSSERSRRRVPLVWDFTETVFSEGVHRDWTVTLFLVQFHSLPIVGVDQYVPLNVGGAAEALNGVCWYTLNGASIFLKLKLFWRWWWEMLGTLYNLHPALGTNSISSTGRGHWDMVVQQSFTQIGVQWNFYGV